MLGTARGCGEERYAKLTRPAPYDSSAPIRRAPSSAAADFLRRFPVEPKVILDKVSQYHPKMSSPLFDYDQDILMEHLGVDHISSSFINSIQNGPLFIDEVIDVKPQLSFGPYDRVGPPVRGDYPGNVKFNAAVSDDNGERKPFLYSPELNRAYLDMMRSELPIEFKWDMQNLQIDNLWIRATLILAGSEQQESRVLRCHNHIVTEDPTNRDVPADILAHVLRSARQTEDVVYCGDKEDDQRWLGVAFRVNQSIAKHGANSISHVYRFCCKHSCSSGINRRRIEVLFTLEDSSGEIYGRKAIGVRVCSCPKRDMDKDLKEFRNRRSGSPVRKRQMITRPSHVIPLAVRNHDDDIFNVNLKIKGIDSVQHILKTAYNEMHVKHDKAIDEISRHGYKQSMLQIEGVQNQILNSPYSVQP